MRKAFYDKPEEIPEADKPFYVEKGGKWVADVDVREHPDALNLKSALDKERLRADTAEKAVKQFGDLTPDALTVLRETAEKFEKTKGKSALDAEDIKRMQADFDGKLKAAADAADAKVKDAEAKTRKIVVDTKMRDIALANGVEPTRVGAAMKLYGDRFDLDDHEDLIVRDAKGNIEATTAERFWGEHAKTESPFLYAGTGSAGSGQQSQDLGRRSGTKTIPLNDNNAFLANLEAVAKGEVVGR